MFTYFSRSFIGAGAIAAGGFHSLLKSIPLFVRTFRGSFRRAGAATADEGVDIPVAPYPKRLVQDGEGRWVERTFARKTIREPDPFYLQCETKPR